MNPSENVNTTFPHIVFIEEVFATVSAIKESGDTDALAAAIRTVRMYHLCSPSPNSKGEPTPGTEKVLSILSLFRNSGFVSVTKCFWLL